LNELHNGRSRVKVSVAKTAALAVVLTVTAVAAPSEASQPRGELPIVAIGDSYTSGEGVPPFEARSDRAGVNQCHRSSLAYPVRLGTSLGVPVESWACSGATTGDLSTTVIRTDQAPWDDPILDVRDGSPLSALDRIRPNTSVVTLTVGGNDLGYSDIVSDCLLGFEPCTKHDAQVQLDLVALEGSLHTLFSDIGTRLTSLAKVLVVGYPRVFPALPAADCDFMPLLPVGVLTVAEQEWADATTADLNAVVRQEAERSNQPGGPEFTYVDTWDVFAGNELCRPDPESGVPATSSPLINGVDLLNPEHSFHPSASGHQALADRVFAVIGGRPPDGESVGLVDPTSGIWNLRNGEGIATSFYYGDPGDFPLSGDWNCDGIDTPGLYRQSDGYVYVRNSNTQGVAGRRFFFGDPGDVPLAGDMNGNGCDTISGYRPSEQRFYIINELGADDGGLGAADYSFVFGNPGDQPVAGDWDGDGIDEVGLHRDSTGLFYWRNTLTTGIADGQIYFGDPGDRFVAGDWGVVDGRDTPAVYRPSDRTVYFRHTLTEGVADSQFLWPGADASWLPVAGGFKLSRGLPSSGSVGD
jgi:lysophospholipase L1-like esterase